MGQILVINVYDHCDNKKFNIYYHWSGFTDAAIDEINRIANEYVRISNSKHYENHFRALIEALYNLGASLDLRKNDGNEALSNYNQLLVNLCDYNMNIVYAIDRNNGLIALTERDMEICDNWADTIVDINIEDTGEIYCDYLGVDGWNYAIDLTGNDTDDYDYFNGYYSEFKRIVMNATENNILETITALNNIGIGVCNSYNIFTSYGKYHPICYKENDVFITERFKVDINKHSRLKGVSMYVALPEIIDTKDEKKIDHIGMFVVIK